jgi:hypothetical protein
MSLKEHVTQALHSLSEAELQQVAEFVAFLKFRARIDATTVLRRAQLASLYAEFADEDSTLAEEGMSDYARGLGQEDTP